jgi:hypothetical protein
MKSLFHAEAILALGKEPQCLLHRSLGGTLIHFRSGEEFPVPTIPGFECMLTSSLQFHGGGNISKRH